MRRKAKLVKAKHGLRAIFIDYLQLMHIEGSKPEEQRIGELTEITRSTKLLAKELDVPVILLSQLNRGVEYRNNKRPMLPDLRECGSIEQDSDIVAFVYRDNYYTDAEDKTLEVIVRKNRSGPTGTVKLCYEHEYERISDLATGDIEESDGVFF